MRHIITIREEFREGMRQSEFRVLCSCGHLEDKAQTEAGTKIIIEKHVRNRRYTVVNL